MTLTLSSRSDEYGFLYGQFRRSHGSAIHCVDVMPPETDWSGGQRLEGYEPHPTDWAVYLNGDPVGRVAAREMIEPRLEMIVPTVEERLRADDD